MGVVAKDAIFAELRALIISGQLPLGTPISERELATRFGVSRTPIRDVLNRLESVGLVDVHPHRGVFVRRPTPDLIREVFEAREAVEGIAAGLAALHHEPVELQAIRARLVEQEVTADPVSWEASGRAGQALHDAIIRWTGNSLLKVFYTRLMDQVSLLRSLSRRYQTIEERSRHDHLMICDALTVRDRQQAEAAMRAHLRATRDGLVHELFEG